MQLREQRVLKESEMHGAEESAEFTIKASGKAFKVLMSGIYSNPQAAAVREVMTNAWDAQVEAGTNDRPFQVHVPSRFDPLFYVRDFGVSMTREKVMRLYTSLFDSSKTDSNDVAGAFGIGSKAPFAVVDAFQVTTWLDGRKTVYQCQMHEAGIPKIHVVGEIESDEPTGVMVSFAVKESDIDPFRKEIRKMLLGFDVVPALLNVDLDADAFFGKAAKITPTQTGAIWRLFGKDFNEAFEGSGLYARQGCVVYPIELKQIEDVARAQQKGEVLALFRSTSWSPSDTTAILDFKIGELSVAASRETLQYDDETIAAIVNVLDKLADELVADAVTLITAEPTPLKAARVFDRLTVGHAFKQLIGARVKIEMDVTDRNTGLTARKEVAIDDIVSKYKHGLRFNADKIEADYGLVMSPVRSTSSRPGFRPAFQVVVDVWNGARFVLDTGELDRSTNRVVTYIEEEGDDKTQIWWVRPCDTSTSQADQEASLRKWLDSMEAELDYDLLADFDPANLGGGSSAGQRADYNAFRRIRLNDGTLGDMQHRAEDGGLYVLLTRGKVKWTDPDGSERLMELNELSRVIATVRSLISKDPLDGRELIGIIGNSHGLVGKHPGWQSLQDLMSGLVAAEIDADELRASAKAWSRDTRVDNPYSEEGKAEEKLIQYSTRWAPNLPAGNLIVEISEDRLDSIKPTRYNQNNITSLVRWFKVEVPSFSPFKAKHILLAKKAMRVYPLLRALNLESSSLNHESVEQYINLIDAANAAADI